MTIQLSRVEQHERMQEQVREYGGNTNNIYVTAGNMLAATLDEQTEHLDDDAVHAIFAAHRALLRRYERLHAEYPHREDYAIQRIAYSNVCYRIQVAMGWITH